MQQLNASGLSEWNQSRLLINNICRFSNYFLWLPNICQNFDEGQQQMDLLGYILISIYIFMVFLKITDNALV